MQLSAKSIRNKSNAFKPVRIAIIDTGFDASHPFIRGQDNQLDARIKAAQNFAQGSNPRDIQDVVGHGTHALGLLLKVATCAEIYIAKVANKENVERDSYDAIVKVRLLIYESKFYASANGLNRRSIVQSLSGK